jgi:hypothetical protein
MDRLLPRVALGELIPPRCGASRAEAAAPRAVRPVWIGRLPSTSRMATAMAPMATAIAMRRHQACRSLIANLSSDAPAMIAAAHSNPTCMRVNSLPEPSLLPGSGPGRTRRRDGKALPWPTASRSVRALPVGTRPVAARECGTATRSSSFGSNIWPCAGCPPAPVCGQSAGNGLPEPSDRVPDL